MQALALASLSWLLVAPWLLRTGTNIVTKTYETSAVRLWAGVSPYLQPPPGAGDWHKCSPFFSLLYSPLAQLPPGAQAAIWAAVNALVFWAGVSRWFRLEKKSAWWAWVALLATSMELDGSLRYQQTNALLAGIILFGIADYRDGRFFRSGLVLAIGSDLKILPAIFALPLLFRPWRKEYAKGLALGSLVAFLAPALVVGLARDVGFHLDWARLLLRDLGAPGLLDIESVLSSLGTAPALARAVRLGVIGVSLLLLFARRLPLPIWTALGLYTVLLASPRTESPTFVLMAPTYVLVARYLAEEGAGWREAAALGVGFFFVTFTFNDLWPKQLWNPLPLHYVTKTLGVIPLWVLSAFLLMRRGQPTRLFSR